MSGQQRIHIGTSGWSYRHWRGAFYPGDVPARAWLAYSLERFHSVEINGSFYRVPKAETLAQWRDTAPPGAIFAAKASRYITHMKKLWEPGRTVPDFLERMGVLGEKLGPILFQLPPQLKFDAERLETFLAALPKGRQWAFEFREASWHREETCALLSRHGAAFCIFDLAGTRSPEAVTADLVYVRLHGPDGAYRGSYSDKALAGWAKKLKGWAGEGRDVYCYFDNDEAGHAALDAQRLQALVAGK